MNKKIVPAVGAGAKIKDTAPELDDVRTIALQNRETPTPYDLTLIEGIAANHIPADEVCAIIRMSKSRFEKHLECQAAYQRGWLLGNANLRRMMTVTAKTQPVMQIWLSKQHLGMTDKVEAPQGESQIDAYKGFLNKLNIIVNVRAEGQPAPTVVGSGKGDSDILLENVGEVVATPTEPPRVVDAGKNSEMDRGVGSDPSRANFHRLLEDVVVSSGKGIGKDESRG
tara:strand:- start:20780 stop:21457 length:678 start_codon:yes stop_codon:yes gene_type:complete